MGIHCLSFVFLDLWCETFVYWLLPLQEVLLLLLVIAFQIWGIVQLSFLCGGMLPPDNTSFSCESLHVCATAFSYDYEISALFFPHP